MGLLGETTASHPLARRKALSSAMATLQTMERRVAFGISRTLGPWIGRTQSSSQRCPPCIMCAWAIEDLHGFGLRHCVILDSSFEGAKARLEALPDMKIVSITHPDSVLRMRTFGRRYPWDWEADIGEILPRHAKYEAIIAKGR